MSDRDNVKPHPAGLTPEELEAERGETLPDREVMSVLTPTDPITDPMPIELLGGGEQP